MNRHPSSLISDGVAVDNFLGLEVITIVWTLIVCIILTKLVYEFYTDY